MKDKIWLFVLAIRSADNEIQMFRPESLMAEIKDSQSCSSRKKKLDRTLRHMLQNICAHPGKKQEEVVCLCQKEGDSLVRLVTYVVLLLNDF